MRSWRHIPPQLSVQSGLNHSHARFGSLKLNVYRYYLMALIHGKTWNVGGIYRLFAQCGQESAKKGNVCKAETVSNKEILPFQSCRQPSHVRCLRCQECLWQGMPKDLLILQPSLHV